MPRYDDEPVPRRPSRPPGLSPAALLLALFAGVALGATIVSVGGRVLDRLRPETPAANPDARPREAAANGPLDADEGEANAVFEGLKPGVVNVDTVFVRRDRSADRLLEQQTGTGSGFVWDADGRVVTNFHVVQDALRRPGMAIRVVTADRQPHDARLVGTAPDYDLAVLQIAPADSLRPVELATSADLKVGQKVFAIGNPFGLSLTLTAGIISNLDRTIESPSGAPIRGAVQHTAQINPGNSGGPLLNKLGRLVGVNTSISSPNGGNVGIGFAIPADTVNRVVTEIVRKGRVAKPDLGVRLYDQQQLRRRGYDRGVMVAEVVPGGPADRAGVRGIRPVPGTRRSEPGDLILAIDGREVAGVDEFQAIVGDLKPGQKVTVRLLRGDDEREVQLVVQGV